jgi:UDP-glucose 4-epimerase
MSRCLVTGGAGFIGAHVANELVGAGHEVTVLDDLSGGFRENLNTAAAFVEGSITDAELVASLFADRRFDHVYHLAAYAAEGLSHFIRRFNYTNNLIGSVNLINESVRHRVRCFVFTSSIAVYGKLPPPMTESMTPAPEDPYGVAKLAVEQDLRAAHEMFGLDYVVFRPHNVYGEFQNIGDRYRNVVGIFMNQLMARQPMTVFGDGTQTRAFSYVGDVAPVIASAVDEPRAFGEVFNIGADREYTVNELARATMEAMGMEQPIRHVEARNEAVHAYADHGKVKQVFGRRKAVPLEEGLRRMADWAKRVGVRRSERFRAIEVTEKLAPLWLED